MEARAKYSYEPISDLPSVTTETAYFDLEPFLEKFMMGLPVDIPGVNTEFDGAYDEEGDGEDFEDFVPPTFGGSRADDMTLLGIVKDSLSPQTPKIPFEEQELPFTPEPGSGNTEGEPAAG